MSWKFPFFLFTFVCLKIHNSITHDHVTWSRTVTKWTFGWPTYNPWFTWQIRFLKHKFLFNKQYDTSGVIKIHFPPYTYRERSSSKMVDTILCHNPTGWNNFIPWSFFFFFGSIGHSTDSTTMYPVLFIHWWIHLYILSVGRHGCCDSLVFSSVYCKPTTGLCCTPAFLTKK